MRFNKKVIAALACLLVLCTVITGVAISNSNTDSDETCTANGLLCSAGAISHIQCSDNMLSAGAMNSFNDISISDGINSDMVVQAPSQDTEEKEEVSKPINPPVIEEEEEDITQYNSFGYTNLGIAIVDGNLNVRSLPSIDGEIVGKMTNYAACEILGEENGWYKISSGELEGYVSADYILTGVMALRAAQGKGSAMATVNTDTLNVRKEPSAESAKITTVSRDADLYVLEILDGWVKIELDSRVGYVAKEYVTIVETLKTGSTLKELQYGEGISEERIKLVTLALQYVGNRYVWGGESLTNGVDCSGFTLKIYEQFGVYLPHYSAAQPAYGTKINPKDALPGDLFFYGNGSQINHVAIYIGNGQIVHAASERSGIIISSAYYSTPICVVRYLDK